MSANPQLSADLFIFSKRDFNKERQLFCTVQTIQVRGYIIETSLLLVVIQRRTLSNIYDGNFLRKTVNYFY